MYSGKGMPTREDMAVQIFASRNMIAAYLEVAVEDGDKKGARSWQALLHKVDKTISKYNLDAYAERPTPSPDIKLLCRLC